MPHETRSSRRLFLKTTSAAAAGLAFMPARSYARVLGANERLNMAVIGTGGMGTSHTNSLVNRKAADNIDVIQVCDVYRRRLNNAMGIIGHGNGTGTMRHEDVLDNSDVDAVVIATPDHWHTKIAIEAMESGKDVYCEKPLSLTIQQALDCRDAVHRTGRTLQVGPQGTSAPHIWAARKAIEQGRIGKVSWTQGSYCRNSRGGQFNWHIDPDAGPNNDTSSDGYVDWNRWLGHEHGLAEKIDWNPDHFFRFRKYYAYNGGLATDLLYHKLAPFTKAISGHNGEYPRRVVSSGGTYLEKDERDIPDTFMMMVDYPSEHTIVLASVMTNDVGVDDVIRGQYGTMNFKSGLHIKEQGTWAPEFREANKDALPEDLSETANGQAKVSLELPARRDHMGNFLDAIRNGDEQACNVDLGASTMVAIKMGVESLRQNKVMLWDEASETMRPA
ncbi:MAG: Gfo/Idh/MocA family oxidoreductase [Phycisphaerales bacterium]|nr:Gfo/Idh/MocA family oxidoreductase [Phycisphaerales bacterium]